MKIKVLGKKPETFQELKNIKLNKSIYLLVKITKKMHLDFIRVSGDNSPIHTDKKFAKKNGYKDIICHGFLIPTILSKIYGKIFPGGSELCISQSLFFRSPIFINDILKIEIKTLRKNPSLNLLEIEVRILIKKKLVLDGIAQFAINLKK